MKVQYMFKLEGAVTLDSGAVAQVRYHEGQLTITGVGIQDSVSILAVLERGFVAQHGAQPQVSGTPTPVKVAEPVKQEPEVPAVRAEEVVVSAEQPKPRTKKLPLRTKPLPEVMADAAKPGNGNVKMAAPEFTPVPVPLPEPPPAQVMPLRPKALPNAGILELPLPKPDLTEPADPWGLTPEGALAEELQNALGVRDVLKFLMSRGVIGVDALIAECDKLKDKLPALSGVKVDLKDRIKRVYAGLEADSAP